MNSRPNFRKLRYEEDYSHLHEAGDRDLFDPVKFLPFTKDGRYYLSLGGEVREHYEFTENPAWGDDPQDRRGTLLQRYVLHGDLHAGEKVRLFVQVLSALEDGRNGGPSPVDEDRLTVQNAFLDVGLPVDPADRLTLRVGRQELLLGSGRLVDVREGPNVRRKFDGGRVLFATQQWQVSGLAVRPAKDKPGIFDDDTDDSRALWGIYCTGPLGPPAGSVDLYYLRFRNEHAQFEQGTAEETRHSLGARLWGNPEGWDYNWEFVYQWGSFGQGDIQAWTVASITGYSWNAVTLQPRLALSANIASGDRNPNDPNLESFNAIFPRGNYFSELALLGPRNFFNIHPFLTLNFPHDIALTSDVNFFWRQSLHDGVYGPSGNLLRRSGDSSKRYVGTATSFNGEWQANRHLAWTVIYTHFFPGSFIEDTGQSNDIDYYELTMLFRF